MPELPKSATIPAELRNLPRWACWQETSEGKPPINATVEWTGRHIYAKTNDPSTWASFAEAESYWRRRLRGNGSACGLSFALNGDGIVGIDLDHCRDVKSKTIDEWAVAIIRRFASYTEITPSGEGVRIFLRGALPQLGRHKGNIEVYGSDKFLTVTGRKLTSHGAGDGIRDQAVELLKWHREVFGASPATPTNKSNEQLVVNDAPTIDPSRLDRLFRVKQKAGEIFRGERNGYPSQSEADMALANYAAAVGFTDQETCDLLVQARLNAGEPVKPLGYFAKTVATARGGVNGHTKTTAAWTPDKKAIVTPEPQAKAASTPLTELARQLAVHLRPDEVEIGAQGHTPGEQDETASWEDVAKVVDGTHWLVPGWIPYGMLSGTIAEPKIGKSAWALWALVRPIVTGCGWFTGQFGSDPGYVVWCDTEGSVGINIKRAKQWGLPLDHIKVPFPEDPFKRIDLDNQEHMDRIENVVSRYKARLVQVDSYRGAHKGDENNSKSGVGLQNLAAVAERTKAAVHIIHHTGKLPAGVELTANNARGSNVFLAMVRCLVGIDIPDPGGDARTVWRRVRMLAENFGEAPPPIGFRFMEGGLEFGPAPTRPTKEEKETGKARAEQWLRVKMKPGQWYPAGEVIAEAEAAGFSPTGTLQRAKAALRVETRKVGKGHKWRRAEG